MSTALRPSELERFRALMSAHLGFAFDDGTQLGSLRSALEERVVETGAQDATAYLERFANPRAAVAELSLLTERLTVGETYFYRYLDQFRAFLEVVLPERSRARAAQRRLRLLCAGCSSGDEPATLAILLHEHMPEIASWDVAILAVDINPAAIAKAQRGTYSAWSLREVDDGVRQRWFQPQGREFVLDARVRQLVRFERQNLCDPQAPQWVPECYDVVFCRNVLMYFTPERAQQVIESIERSLLLGGFFFLGHAETHLGRSSRLRMLHTHETFYFQRDDAAARPESALPPYVAGHISLRPPPPPPALTDESWASGIAQATERIAGLARAQRTSEPGARGPAPESVFDFGLVLELLRQERFDEALDQLARLPRESEDNPDVQLFRAVVLVNRGEMIAAEQTCRKLLELDEFNAGARYLLGLCREQLGESAAARDHYRTALYFEPTFAMPHLRIGLLARALGEHAEARRELALALVLLAEEDSTRVVLFGGGFSRELLEQLCRSELRACGGAA